MIKEKAEIGEEFYKIKIASSNGNELIADEPLENGGKNLGFAPKELLASALAACTAATLKMYANHKGFDLQEVKVENELVWDKEAGKTSIQRNIELIGNLDEDQRARLLQIANSCPVHKILQNPIEINTNLTLE